MCYELSWFRMSLYFWCFVAQWLVVMLRNCMSPCYNYQRNRMRERIKNKKGKRLEAYQGKELASLDRPVWPATPTTGSIKMSESFIVSVKMCRPSIEKFGLIGLFFVWSCCVVRPWKKSSLVRHTWPYSHSHLTFVLNTVKVFYCCFFHEKMRFI